MFLDKQNEFSDAQAVTVTALSTNVIDTLPMTSNPNVSQDLSAHGGGPYILFSVPTAFTAGGAATLTITIESDSTANLATSPTVHWTSAAIPVASLVAGYQFFVPIPIGLVERYLGVRYTVATGPMTAGAIDAAVVRDIQTWRSYATASASNA
jgi:hypothetical protein